MKHTFTPIHCAIWVVLCLTTGCNAVKLPMNEGKTTQDTRPALVEKRETLTATGYAVISVQPHKSPAQQRLMAIRASKLDAYRSLAEQVYGQQLDSNSSVASLVMTNDTFRTKVEGLIYGARLVSITPVGDDTYETTLTLDKDMVRELRSVFLEQVVATGR
jgi:outer membrane protein FlgP